MTLAITFLVLLVAVSIFLFAISLVLQGYYYGQPTDRLALRSLASGVLAAGFITGWIYLNTRADPPNKYGTLFEFNSTASQPLDEFTAIRLHVLKGPDGQPLQSKARYRKQQGGQQGGGFFENGDYGRPFKLTSADWLVQAVEISEGEKTSRFEAELFVPHETKPGELRPWTPQDKTLPMFSREAARVFREVNGRRYIEFVQGSPGSIQVPNRGAWVGAMVLNALHFLVWFIIFWPILRYTSGIALGLAAGMTLMILLFAMPILFDRNRLPPPLPDIPVVPVPAEASPSERSPAEAPGTTPERKP